MRKFVRTKGPDFLTAKWKDWGSKYRQSREQNRSHIFKWPQLEKQSLNHHLLPVLKSLTQDHCSYCDIYPLMSSDHTIDHFGPKSNPLFYDEVCKWENLYVSCNRCQGAKKEQYHARLLRPDDEAYRFSEYFLYDYTTHRIEINTAASPENQERAKITRSIFDFNEPGLLIARRKAFQRFIGTIDPELDDFDFRFMFEP
jgi:uncharacterized protein (TIGR02646 family)